MGLLTWRQSADEVCRRIASTKAVLKIVLKIKDDPFMFERWINHLIRIVDFSQIIVFDNESTDTEIFDIYTKSH